MSDLPDTAQCRQCGVMIYRAATGDHLMQGWVWLRVDREGDEVGDLCVLPGDGTVGQYRTHVP